MGQIGSNSALSSYATDYQYRTEQTKKNETTEKASKTEKKTKVSGRTIGEPQLSEKAAKYYEQLKAKFSNMDFILVSSDKKEEAERNKGMYQSSKELIVLIDEEKIEKMAEDEAYRQKYEGILSGATAQVNQMKAELGSSAESVSSIGMSFDDRGNASFFAVVDKSLAAQKERIEEKKAEKAEAKKKAEKEADKERLEERTEAAAEKAEQIKEGQTKVYGYGSKDKVTVTASTWEELLTKIDAALGNQRADSVMTAAEKAVGGTIDYLV